MLTTNTGFRFSGLLTVVGNSTTTPETSTLVMDSTAASRTVTLHDAAQAPGQLIFIKKLVAGNTVTITPATGTIEGVASYVLYNIGSSVIIQSDGTNWKIIGGVPDPGGANPIVYSFPSWLKFTVTHTQLQAAALTNNITLFALPAGGFVHATKIKQSTIFAGTGITDYKVSLGLTGDLTKYGSLYDVDVAVAATTFQFTSILDSTDNGSAVNVKIAAQSAGANLNQSTGGVVEIGLLVSVCTSP